ISLTAPVFGNIAVTLAACGLVVAGGSARTAILARLADRWILWGLGAMLVVFTALRPTLLRDTLFATANNLGPDVTFRFSPGGGGLWGVTWLVLVPLVAAALIAIRFPRDRLWRVVVIGFGYLYLLMPFLRGSPWRIGYGDSGNRIASHIVLVLVAYLVLALLEGRTHPTRRNA
ncbi:MAG TPA: hypothetical protein VMM81_02120, partial [Acidimicrobiia bacterium]|nr:hypothetical protein [Acidimicrobiia bacterium]